MKGNNDNNVFYVGHDPVHDEYKVLSMVREVSNEEERVENLMNYNGNVSIFQSLNFFRDRIVDVWVLEEGGRSQWSDKKAFVLPDFQMNFQHGDRLWMGGTSRSGEVWFSKASLLLNQPSRFFIYDLERNEMTQRIVTGPLVDVVFKKICWLMSVFSDDISPP
ncbi:F-box associated ubiquitination effector family protein [Arabidopsis thaliana]|uniref:F-box associated ubiquitination effector family protein n=1 Tax=Arabidopsis thaliana TaxID=3702 RepID=F4I4K9_ARATH|nr:F-box associated ubiquitination effector family protein [Arabidopsis thaliana]AEE30325.1 F-box associated ubiquitination effector family protein [Arabidopsis thaliana]|eukprot:NP_001154358.1 F-box associated ubiquitination effector family protein [Arabidopsis thaliana]